jgi:uncharacterized protein YneR
MEKEINHSEKSFGYELMDKAEKLFRKNDSSKIALYNFSEKDWGFLTKDLRQFGFKQFLDESIGEPIFLISPEKLKIVQTKKYGTFLIPSSSPLYKKEITFSEGEENNNLEAKELGKTNGFKLSLNTETIPNKENIICQYQQLSLVVNIYNSYYFLEENILIVNKLKRKKMEKVEITKMKRADLKEIRLFQKILRKI